MPLWEKSIPLDNRENPLLIILAITLKKIKEDTRRKSDTRINSKSYREQILKYETAVTTFIFRFIFDITTNLSNYLQTKRLEILKAYNIVKKL